jgi:hypothetical protein
MEILLLAEVEVEVVEEAVAVGVATSHKGQADKMLLAVAMQPLRTSAQHSLISFSLLSPLL